MLNLCGLRQSGVLLVQLHLCRSGPRFLSWLSRQCAHYQAVEYKKLRISVFADLKQKYPNLIGEMIKIKGHFGNIAITQDEVTQKTHAEFKKEMTDAFEMMKSLKQK